MSWEWSSEEEMKGVQMKKRWRGGKEGGMEREGGRR